MVACSAPATLPAATPTEAPKRDLAVAAPVEKAPTPPERERDPNDRFKPPERRRPVPEVQRPQDIAVAETDMWSPCVRAYWQAQSDPVRAALRALFRRYMATCDQEGHVVVSAPEYGKPSIAFRGTLGDASVAFIACDTETEDVAIVLDGKRVWSGLGDRRDNCTVVIPDGRSLRRALRASMDTRDAVVHVGIDFAITDDIKADLRLMLDALDALSAQ